MDFNYEANDWIDSIIQGFAISGATQELETTHFDKVLIKQIMDGLKEYSLVRVQDIQVDSQSYLIVSYSGKGVPKKSRGKAKVIDMQAYKKSGQLKYL
jgi:hypothetical protein